MNFDGLDCLLHLICDREGCLGLRLLLKGLLDILMEQFCRYTFLLDFATPHHVALSSFVDHHELATDRVQSSKTIS